MKRPVVSLDLFSLFAGAGMTVLLMVAASAAFPAGGPAERDIQRTSVLGQPSPHDNITIDETTPFLVPGDKHFVVTSFGSTHFSGDAYIFFDGSQRCARNWNSNGSVLTVSAVPPFLIADPGTTVSISGSSSCWATGYLIDA